MKNKGISLMVLVITIIVVIILATAVITSFINNNIIKLAKEASFKSSAKDYESELSIYLTGRLLNNSLGMTNENYEGSNGEYPITDAIASMKKDDIDKFAVKNGQLVYIGNDVDEINYSKKIDINVAPKGGNIYKDINGGVVPVPKGFSVSTQTNENNISQGLVMKDTYGNEFVWVPVNITKYTNYYRDSNRVGVDSSLPAGVLSETNQISKYGGFYIGRYEASYDYNAGNPRVAIKKSQYASSNLGDFGINSQYDKYLWNFILSNEAKSYAEQMSTKYSYDSTVKTGLTTGKQWDNTLKWIGDEKVNYSASWGNYMAAVSPATNGNYQSGILKPSGSNENWKVNNIYDIAGNLSEWTNELYGTEYLMHDTPYSDSNAVLTFYWPNSVYRYASIGFRVTLFID